MSLMSCDFLASQQPCAHSLMHVSALHRSDIPMCYWFLIYNHCFLKLPPRRGQTLSGISLISLSWKVFRQPPDQHIQQPALYRLKRRCRLLEPKKWRNLWMSALAMSAMQTQASTLRWNQQMVGSAAGTMVAAGRTCSQQNRIVFWCFATWMPTAVN